MGKEYEGNQSCQGKIHYLGLSSPSDHNSLLHYPNPHCNCIVVMLVVFGKWLFVIGCWLCVVSPRDPTKLALWGSIVRCRVWTCPTSVVYASGVYRQIGSHLIG